MKSLFQFVLFAIAVFVFGTLALKLFGVFADNFDPSPAAVVVLALGAVAYLVYKIAQPKRID